MIDPSITRLICTSDDNLRIMRGGDIINLLIYDLINIFYIFYATLYVFLSSSFVNIALTPIVKEKWKGKILNIGKNQKSRLLLWIGYTFNTQYDLQPSVVSAINVGWSEM